MKPKEPGSSFTKKVLTGGAAKSDVWLQIFADCFQTAVEIPDGTELGALGAAIAGGVACGCFVDYHQAIDNMVSFSKRIEPNPDMKDIYQEKYARYKKVIQTLDPIWKDLSMLGNPPKRPAGVPGADPTKEYRCYDVNY